MSATLADFLAAGTAYAQASQATVAAQATVTAGTATVAQRKSDADRALQLVETAANASPFVLATYQARLKEYGTASRKLNQAQAQLDTATTTLTNAQAQQAFTLKNLQSVADALASDPA